MPDVINLSCPVCENSLSIPATIKRFACVQCGTALMLQTKGGIAFLIPTSDSAQGAASTSGDATESPIGAIASSSAASQQDDTLATLRSQVDAVSKELERLKSAPQEQAGTKGKLIGKILFGLAGTGFVLAALFAFIVDNSVVWEGIAGISVVLATLGIVFFGDGQRTMQAEKKQHLAKIHDLESMKESGLKEIARLERE